jgi:hypothetical protein
MSDKAKLIASASVQVSTPFISFNSKTGFKNAVYNAQGVYTLELEHHHDTKKLVVQVTPNNTQLDSIVASTPDGKHVQVNNFNGGSGGGAADSSFYINVYRIGD